MPRKPAARPVVEPDTTEDASATTPTPDVELLDETAGETMPAAASAVAEVAPIDVPKAIAQLVAAGVQVKDAIPAVAARAGISNSAAHTRYYRMRSEQAADAEPAAKPATSRKTSSAKSNAKSNAAVARTSLAEEARQLAERLASARRSAGAAQRELEQAELAMRAHLRRVEEISRALGV